MGVELHFAVSGHARTASLGRRCVSSEEKEKETKEVRMMLSSERGLRSRPEELKNRKHRSEG